MPNPKDLYDAAVARIKAIADGKADASEIAPPLKDINLYVVELRRNKAALSARVQGLEAEVNALRRELGRYRAMPGELEVARSTALNLGRRNVALEATIRECEGTVEGLKARLRDCEAATVTRESTFTLVKAKCLACGLHFSLCTWAPQRHGRASLHCPECGQHAGRFLVWAEPGRGLIFQHVPGKAPLVAVGLGPIPDRGMGQRDREGRPVESAGPGEGKETEESRG
jgi:hypothetical protein